MPDGERRVNLSGIEFDPLDEEAFSEHLVRSLKGSRGGRVVTPNMQMLTAVRKTPPLLTLVNEHDCVLADGTPFIWAARLRGLHLQRMTGSDLIGTVAALAGSYGWRVFVLGGRPADAPRVVESFERLGATVVGIDTSVLSLPVDEVEISKLHRQLVEARADVVIVGLGFPKQEQVSLELSRLMPETWFFNFGMAIAYFAGTRRRAPRVMQVMGAEWLWRLASEPRRLAKRYLVESLPSAARLLAESLHARREGVR